MKKEITYEDIEEKINIRLADEGIGYYQYTFKEPNSNNENVSICFENINNFWYVYIYPLDKDGLVIKDNYNRCACNPQTKQTEELKSFFEIRESEGSDFSDTYNDIKEDDDNWILEATEENKQKLIVEIYKRFYGL